MRTFLRDNGLSIAFGLLLLGSLVGQALSGHAMIVNQLVARGVEGISMGQYLTSADFAVDVAENWQSEYLQFFLYIMATVWLIQRGSPESKPDERIGTETDEEQKVGAYATERSPAWARAGGWRTALFSRSLGLVMLGLFLLSWLAQSVAGVASYNSEQIMDFEEPLTWARYLGAADFWNRTMQNWQSEFLAIGSMVILSVYLRQRGSPESKPVGAAHATTDENG
ncbi:DUF6766 family protein [Actinokineospora iranica]|uniref:Uncharacterized protein n=1 Tax=Actinokineospora iranica TaxID=1271860 RepID=A0A1G6MAG9_9PSEU|nr:DUF6766 family protein [Actinokineospora iranica]SDC51976.1 hypothetical protein SAMN05216174_102431 [Actinokineospora iranica]